MMLIGIHKVSSRMWFKSIDLPFTCIGIFLNSLKTVIVLEYVLMCKIVPSPFGSSPRQFLRELWGNFLGRSFENLRHKSGEKAKSYRPFRSPLFPKNTFFWEVEEQMEQHPDPMSAGFFFFWNEDNWIYSFCWHLD